VAKGSLIASIRTRGGGGFNPGPSGLGNFRKGWRRSRITGFEENMNKTTDQKKRSKRMYSGGKYYSSVKTPFSADSFNVPDKRRRGQSSWGVKRQTAVTQKGRLLAEKKLVMLEYL